MINYYTDIDYGDVEILTVNVYTDRVETFFNDKIKTFYFKQDIVFFKSFLVYNNINSLEINHTNDSISYYITSNFDRFFSLCEDREMKYKINTIMD